MMDPDSQLRNLRDFLLVYNRMTEICFQRCSSNFNYRNLTMDESHCVDSCAGKLIRSNHRLMATYSQLMPRMVQRRMEEMESKAAELAAATEASPASETLTAAAPSPPLAPAPAATDVGPEAPGSVSWPAALDIPLESDTAASKSTIVAAVQSSASTPLTAAEAGNLPVVETADSTPSYTAGPPVPPVGGA